MGRPLRIEYPDAFYHITARGIDRKNIFKSNSDQERGGQVSTINK